MKSANRKARHGTPPPQAEVSSARNKLQDVMKRERTKLIAKRAQLDMLTSSQFLNSPGNQDRPGGQQLAPGQQYAGHVQ